MGGGAGQALLQRVITFVVDPAIMVLFTAGLFLFFWGIVEFLWGIKDGKVDDQGKWHILYGLIGMLVMVSARSIIMLITNSLGLDMNTATDVSRINSVNPVGGFFGR